MIKFPISTFIAFLTLTSFIMAENISKQKSESNPIGIYFGGFGGGGYSSGHTIQKETTFSPTESGDSVPLSDSVVSEGNGFWFGGLHVGYEWLNKNTQSWSLTPAAELEGYFFANTKDATFLNTNDGIDFKQFLDTFPMRGGIILTNAILALTNNYITPYIGGGIGAGIVSIHGANSVQMGPSDNKTYHFNANPKAFDWSFAAQAKGGLRYSPLKYLRLFAEYRFLYLSPTNYVFGSTHYPKHVPTSKWDVTFSSIYYNLFSIGIDFTF